MNPIGMWLERSLSDNKTSSNLTRVNLLLLDIGSSVNATPACDTFGKSRKNIPRVETR